MAAGLRMAKIKDLIPNEINPLMHGGNNWSYLLKQTFSIRMIRLISKSMTSQPG